MEEERSRVWLSVSDPRVSPDQRLFRDLCFCSPKHGASWGWTLSQQSGKTGVSYLKSLTVPPFSWSPCHLQGPRGCLALPSVDMSQEPPLTLAVWSLL